MIAVAAMINVNVLDISCDVQNAEKGPGLKWCICVSLQFGGVAQYMSLNILQINQLPWTPYQDTLLQFQNL
jgi:hypothetical protein